MVLKENCLSRPSPNCENDETTSEMEIGGNPNQKEFGYRQYQVELIEAAIRQNLILCLPTGSGKTFIALKVMEHFLARNKGSQKKMVFLANTIPLVKQQAEFFRQHLPQGCPVTIMTGDMGSDYYSKDHWDKFLGTFDVLVMTIKILSNALNHGNIHWNQISLLTLDECHHATKDNEIVKIMERYMEAKAANSDVPRVLGLTATVINGGIKTNSNKIEEEIIGLQRRLCCRAVTHPNTKEIMRFSTQATVERCKLPAPIFLSSSTCCMALYKLEEKVSKLANEVRQTNANNQKFRNSVQWSDRKIHILKECSKVLLDVVEIYQELGPYAATIASQIKGKLVERYQQEIGKKQPRNCEELDAVTNVNSGLKKFREDIMHNLKESYCNLLTKYTSFEEFVLKTTASEKVMKVLEILKIKSPNTMQKSEEPLCGLLFCQKRSTALVLNWLLQDYSKYCPEYSFLQVSFVLGCASKTLDLNENRKNSTWQASVLQSFRNKEINLVVCTSVLEEGLDVPSCNVVIRFDCISNYPSYVQSMGRARMCEAKFYVLVPECIFQAECTKLRKFDQVNQDLARTLAEKLDKIDDELDILEPVETTVGTFCPGGTVDSPKLPETAVIHSVYRYCGQLGCDGIPAASPVCWYESIDGKFKAYLQLPCSTPIRNMIEGDVFKSKRHAKRSVFKKACELLYEAGELTELLLPKRLDDNDVVENDFLQGLAHDNLRRAGMSKLGTKKSIRIYNKTMPLEVYAGSITPKQSGHLYEVKMSYIPSQKNFSIDYSLDFSNQPYSYGIISSLDLSKIPPFNLAVSTGSISVCVVQQKRRDLTEGQIDMIRRFQTFLGDFVHCSALTSRLTEKKTQKLLIVPLYSNGDCTAKQIAWKEMEKLANFRALDYTVPPSAVGQSFHFNETLYSGATVITWHQEVGENCPTIYYVHRISDCLTSNSPLKTGTFASHFLSRWNVKVSKPELPLLVCHAIGKQRNFLKCVPSAKGPCKFEFPPEICNVTPIPASLLLQGKYLMSIIHRLNRLAVAVALKEQVGQSNNWNLYDHSFDKENFGSHGHDAEKGYAVWSDQHNQQIVAKLSALRLKIPQENIKYGLEYSHPNTWTTEEIMEEVTQQINLRENSNFKYKCRANKKHMNLPSNIPCRDITSGLISTKDVKSLSLDAPTDFSKVTGPSIFGIMEALTLAGSNDYLNLEKLEIMGDSVLKWISSVHIFSNFPAWKEGKMTRVRTQFICNEHLCAVAQRRHFGEYLAGSIFQQENWVPPGYESLPAASVPVEQTIDDHSILSPNPSPGQICVSDKSLADCVEALIGVYFLNGGIDSALRIMQWIGLQGPGQNSTSGPYSREYSLKKPTSLYNPGNESPYNVVPYLEDLEKIVDYCFTNKWMLVEALTHPTYMHNAVTQTYQRFEFIGDAVLDFLVTNFIFNNTGIQKPGRVTDLRSALVNNVTLACVAVRYSLHKYMLHTSEMLQEKISRFEDFQKSLHYQTVDPYMLTNEDECAVLQDVDIPKALGDIFEAIIGAVFVDSGFSLDAVWKVIYRLMKQELDAFSVHIPINPVRKLMETFPDPGQVIVLDKNDGKNDIKCIEITISGTNLLGRGVATTKKSAKEAAAKSILRDILIKS